VQDRLAREEAKFRTRLVFRLGCLVYTWPGTRVSFWNGMWVNE